MTVTYVETESPLYTIARDIAELELERCPGHSDKSKRYYALFRKTRWWIFSSRRYVAFVEHSKARPSVVKISYDNEHGDEELITEYAESLSDEGLSVTLDYTGEL